MDVPVDILTPFVPKWGSPDDWNEAYEKVENYLRARRINRHVHENLRFPQFTRAKYELEELILCLD